MDFAKNGMGSKAHFGPQGVELEGSNQCQQYCLRSNLGHPLCDVKSPTQANRLRNRCRKEAPETWEDNVNGVLGFRIEVDLVEGRQQNRVAFADYLPILSVLVIPLCLPAPLLHSKRNFIMFRSRNHSISCLFRSSRRDLLRQLRSYIEQITFHFFVFSDRITLNSSALSGACGPRTERSRRL